MKKIISMFLISIMCIVMVNPTIANAAVKISKAKATMEIDSTLKLSINTDSKVSWSTNKKTVAAINSTGTITAKAEGQATITATTGDKKYTCTVSVINSNKSSFDDTLDPGEYLIGTDISSGKYDLNCTEGGGIVYIYESEKAYENDEYYIKTVLLATGEMLEGLIGMYSENYNNLSLKSGQYMVIGSGVKIHFEK